MPKSELDYIKAFADGKIEMGRSWGAAELDQHWRWKKNFTIVLGHSGIGKTKLVIYLELVAAIKYNHHILIYTSENTSAVVKMELIECLAGKKIRYNHQRQMSDVEIEQHYQTLTKYCTFIDQTQVFAWQELKGVIEHLLQKNDSIKSIIIDPYNSLKVDKAVLGQLSTHDYHYEVASEMRVKQSQWDCRLVVCMHPATESARRTIKDAQHPYTGYDDFPKPSDAEQGSKWKNRSDDFIVFHRIYNHPTDSNTIFIKVDKIKEQFTGGMPTPFDKDNFGIKAVWNYRDNRFIFDGTDILHTALSNTGTVKELLTVEKIEEEKETLIEFDDLPF